MKEFIHCAILVIWSMLSVTAIARSGRSWEEQCVHRLSIAVADYGFRHDGKFPKSWHEVFPNTDDATDIGRELDDVLNFRNRYKFPLDDIKLNIYGESFSIIVMAVTSGEEGDISTESGLEPGRFAFLRDSKGKLKCVKLSEKFFANGFNSIGMNLQDYTGLAGRWTESETHPPPEVYLARKKRERISDVVKWVMLIVVPIVFLMMALYKGKCFLNRQRGQ